MICAECGTPTCFWLCSDACALAWSKRRGRRSCAICSYHAKTGRIGRNDTTKICGGCRARSENSDWVHKEREEAAELIETRLDAFQRFRDQQDRPLPAADELLATVAKMIVEGERIAYVYRDKRGRRRGTKYRSRAYTARRIAAKLGRTRWEIERLIGSIES